MKVLYSISLLFLAHLVLSCTESANDNVVKIHTSQKKNAKNLELEDVPVKNVLEFAENCFVYDDILVVQNYKESNRHLLEFIDLRTMNTVKQAIMRGNGPGELIQINVFNSKDYLLVDGVSNHKYAKINVSDFINGETDKIVYKDYNFQTQRKYLFNDSLFLVVNPYRFINKKLNIEQDDPRFLLLSETDKIKRNGRLSAININAGGIMVNHCNQKICYYSKGVPEIEIYDFDLNLIKTIKGPDIIEPEYAIVSDILINYSAKAPTTYTCACFDDTYMYLAYEGRFIDAAEVIRNSGKIDNSDTWIFKIDWDGKVRDSYKVDKKNKIKSMSITKRGELYLCCEVEGITKLFKAHW